MKIGVLEAGKVNPKLVPAHGEYVERFKNFINQGEHVYEVFGVDIISGASPPAPTDADGWMITGSKYGAYEDTPWMATLEQLIRDIYAQGVPLVGICFGHQIIAKALGGKVIKVDKGWGLGVQHYEMKVVPPYMNAFQVEDQVHILGLHQDQVVELAEDVTILGGSSFCPYAILSYGPVDKPRIVTFQAHPEFDIPYLKDLIVLRTGQAFSETVANQAIDTFEKVQYDMAQLSHKSMGIACNQYFNLFHKS